MRRRWEQARAEAWGDQERRDRARRARDWRAAPAKLVAMSPKERRVLRHAWNCAPYRAAKVETSSKIKPTPASSDKDLESCTSVKRSKAALQAVARAKAAVEARFSDDDLPDDLDAAVIQDLNDHLETHSELRGAIETARQMTAENWPDGLDDEKPLRKRGA